MVLVMHDTRSFYYFFLSLSPVLLPVECTRAYVQTATSIKVLQRRAGDLLILVDDDGGVDYGDDVATCSGCE